MLWSHKIVRKNMIVRIENIVRNSDSQDILRKVDVLGRCLYECHVGIGAFY